MDSEGSDSDNESDFIPPEMIAAAKEINLKSLPDTLAILNTARAGITYFAHSYHNVLLNDEERVKKYQRSSWLSVTESFYELGIYLML